MRWTPLLLVVGCADVLPDETPYVDAPRVLAVQAAPAEVAAGEVTHLTALYADASGALTEGDVDWALCLATKPLAELGPVNEGCLDPASPDLSLIGSGLEVDATLPVDACSLFGPNPPPAEDGSSGGRPTDPDVTGGYYQPALGFVDGGAADTMLAPLRIRCGLANVSQETYVAWNLGYHSNENPAVTSFTVDGADAGSTTVAPGATVALGAGWADCPADPVCGDGVCSAGEDQTSCAEDCATPVGCGGAESYVVYDGETLNTRREAISAAWFTTGGGLAEARNGQDGDDTSAAVSNTWTAPESAGDVWLGVVLRDERGGVGYAGYHVTVGP